MVSVETLGAGGGSICSVTSGRLRVGPESAGADPGPVCYGRGATRPTVTDASLVLGLLSEDSEFAGGSFALTRKGVDEAFMEHVAGPLGCSVEAAAFDCWRVVNANMTQAVRRVTAERGTDPRDLTLLAYGGNGPLFAGIQAEELGISHVIVPKTSPAFSALGALIAAPSIDEERSYLVAAGRADVDHLRALWRELDRRAERFLGAAGFARADLRARYQLNLRYPGQNWSLGIDLALVRGALDLSFVDRSLPERAIAAFHQRHLEEYGHSRLAEQPEITGVRQVTWAEVPRPDVASGFTAPRREAAPSGNRRANLGEGFGRTAIYAGPRLEPGEFVTGPAIIEETFTTIAVHPGWQAVLDDAGDYSLRVAS
jgi:N-methylhydantoinase A